MTFFLIVLVAAYVFEYINGFHDSANAIATVVSTKVLSPRRAVLWAAFWNLFGALMGTAVATTIGQGLVDTSVVTMPTVLAALLSAIIWDLFTWWLGLPSSSSHALIGGLCGAALAVAGGRWSVLKWSVMDAKGASAGLWPKIVLPMVTSPAAGFILGMLLMFLLLVSLRNVTPRVVSLIFGKAQLFSSGFLGFSHGSNDAQKTMGVIALALFAGTEAGGWRIIRTMGHKMVKLQPIHGFAAETTASLIIHVATTIGAPISTTHVISTSIMGVGATKRLSAVKWGIVERIVWAWVLTLPVTGLTGYLLMLLIRGAGAH